MNVCQPLFKLATRDTFDKEPLSFVIVDGSSDYTNIVYFYVSEEYQYKICFEISNNSKIDLNYFSLHKGFKSDF